MDVKIKQGQDQRETSGMTAEFWLMFHHWRFESEH